MIIMAFNALLRPFDNLNYAITLLLHSQAHVSQTIMQRTILLNYSICKTFTLVIHDGLILLPNLNFALFYCARLYSFQTSLFKCLLLNQSYLKLTFLFLTWNILINIQCYLKQGGCCMDLFVVNSYGSAFQVGILQSLMKCSSFGLQ